MKTPESILISERLTELMPVKTTGEEFRQFVKQLETTAVTYRKWLEGDMPYAFILLARLRQIHNLDLNYIFSNEKKKKGDMN